MAMETDPSFEAAVVREKWDVRDSKKSFSQWSDFLAHCIVDRLDPETFETYSPLVYSKFPLSSNAIADVLLRPSPTNRDSLDPRIPRYLQILFQQKYIDTPSILRALYRYSTSHSKTQNIQNQDATNADTDKTSALKWSSSYAAEEVIFYRLTKSNSQGTAIKSASEALEVCKIMAKWMSLFTTAAAAFSQDVMGQLNNSHLKDEMEASRAAFVMLLLGFCEHPVALKALSRPFAKDARKALSDSLADFIPSILQSSSPIASRLELFRTGILASYEPADKKKAAANAELDDLLDSTVGLDSFVIPELPIANSRAGLYIYLNAALVGRPLLDDTALFSYLHNRYQGDIQATTMDLMLASFDVLANAVAVSRTEGQTNAHVLRSYLINKLPLLLVQLSASMYPPLTPEFCITEAFTQIDTNAFPTLSSMFDETNNSNSFTDTVRSDFCFSCCLHGLIPESSIETLLGEMTYQTLPAGGRYVKDDLVNQCLSDPERMTSLINELDNMDGNMGAACQALTEVIGRLCTNKDAMSLKTLCSQLARKPLALDVMLLFDKPITLLHPLCELLDNWRYEEDQGEYQPVYEEFGAVLLLVLAFVHRYSLTPYDIGIRSSDSFVAKLLSRGHLSRPLDDLSDQEKNHLSGWINGLFDTEAGGLGDELMSQCPPQDFYLLVPTLFHNIVLASSTNHLNEETLKSGIEYLVDTFLLPSLVMAIAFLSNHLLADRSPDQKAVLGILQLIILPKQGSNEAQTMLTSVLNIAAKPLETSLRAYQRADPKNQEVQPLLKAIKDNIPLSRRTGGADHNELEGWTNTANGGLTAAVRSTFVSFVQWSLNPGINISPTSYTHRQILAAQKILGAKRVLKIYLEEVRHQTDAGGGSVAYDVATALVCAPDANNISSAMPLSLLVNGGTPPLPPQKRLTLREALRYEAEDCKKLQKTDQVMAETVVRLYRKVEAQMVMPQVPEAILDTSLNLGLDNAAAAELGDAIAAAQNEGLSVDASAVDLGLGSAGADLADLTDLTGSGGGLGLGGDDDIFGDLGDIGGGSGGFDAWDSMDLG